MSRNTHFNPKRRVFSAHPNTTFNYNSRVKDEDVYRRADETPAVLHIGLTHYFQFYNAQRRHQTLNRQTP
ncbi:MAG: integrase core domain-containing protein, partial [Nitrospira sp.]|nr:integrase core domain-containing protein [Nitrospira sp.]